LQDWLKEMSTFVKTIDSNHLLTVDLEGFYSFKNPKSLTINPEEWASWLGSFATPTSLTLILLLFNYKLCQKSVFFTFLSKYSFSILLIDFNWKEMIKISKLGYV